MSAKVALITGGASGIGAATADALLRSGWRVATVDLDVGPAAARAVDHADQSLAIQADVRLPEAARNACKQVVGQWGRLDLLVNSAGVNRHAPLEVLSHEDWSLVLDVNLTGTFLFMQAAAHHMLKAGSGAMVNISSIAGARGVPDRSAYAATKAAVESLTRSAAVGWAARGIRVNAVAPGFTETPLVTTFIESGAIDRDRLINTTPMRRLASPAEIAAVIIFLAGNDSSFITGQTIYADGGFTAEYGVPARSSDDR